MPTSDRRPRGAPDLAPRELRRADEAKSLSAAQTHEAIRRQGEHELERTPAALAWSALAAGAAMGLSLVAHGLLHHYLPDAHWRPLVSSLGYSVGFLVVILGSQQLFTETTVTATLPLLARRDGATARRAARLWAVVLAGNLAGAALFAGVAGGTELFEPGVKDAFAELSHEAMRGGFGTKVLEAIVAGWLIGLVAWTLPAVREKVVVIVILTWLVSAAKLTHVVAGAVEAFYLAVTGGQTWGVALGGYVLPALLGNAIGGALGVAAINHAQVTAGGGREA